MFLSIFDVCVYWYIKVKYLCKMKRLLVVVMFNFLFFEFGLVDCKDIFVISVLGGLFMEVVKLDGGINKYRMWKGLINLEVVEIFVC